MSISPFFLHFSSPFFTFLWGGRTPILTPLQPEYSLDPYVHFILDWWDDRPATGDRSILHRSVLFQEQGNCSTECPLFSAKNNKTSVLRTSSYFWAVFSVHSVITKDMISINNKILIANKYFVDFLIFRFINIYWHHCFFPKKSLKFG